MKSLIVTAHPSSLGFTHKIANSYKKGVESAGGVAEIIDLYKEPAQGFLYFENPHSFGDDRLRDSYQTKIKEANNIVFIHPLWWGAPPAIMKNFLDSNFTSHFAFKYVDGRPVGLLEGKTASLYLTCDGPIWLYRFLGLPFKTIWTMIFFHTCGLRTKNVRILDKKFKRTEEELNKFLKKVEADGRKIV